MHDDYARLHGRFRKVDEKPDSAYRTSDMVVVGLFIGIDNLKPFEISYIKNFYNLTGRGFTHRVVDEYPVKMNRSAYSCFIVFEKTLGDKLKRRREELGLTQEQLADKTRINLAFIRKLESEGFIPSPWGAERLDAILQLPDGTADKWINGD